MQRKKCGMTTQIFSRVCGYHRPVRNWNKGKQEEFKDRKAFNVQTSLEEKTACSETSDAEKTAAAAEV